MIQTDTINHHDGNRDDQMDFVRPSIFSATALNVHGEDQSAGGTPACMLWSEIGGAVLNGLLEPSPVFAFTHTFKLIDSGFGWRSAVSMTSTNGLWHMAFMPLVGNATQEFLAGVAAGDGLCRSFSARNSRDMVVFHVPGAAEFCARAATLVTPTSGDGAEFRSQIRSVTEKLTSRLQHVMNKAQATEKKGYVSPCVPGELELSPLDRVHVRNAMQAVVQAA